MKLFQVPPIEKQVSLLLVLFFCTSFSAFAQFGTTQYDLLETGRASEFAYPMDINGDGDQDMLLVGFNAIGVYLNEGDADFRRVQQISTSLDVFDNYYYRQVINFALPVYSRDLDSDGDLDFIALRDVGESSTIVWYENLHPTEGFATEQVLATLPGSPRSIDFADFDGNTYQDIVVHTTATESIEVYPLSEVGNQPVLAAPYQCSCGSIQKVLAANLDDDTEMDVVFVDSGNNIKWLEGLGSFSFGAAAVLNTSSFAVTDFQIGDLDGDTDLDIAAVSQEDNKLEWFEQNDLVFGLDAPVTIASIFRPVRIYISNVDGDNANEVLISSFNFPTGEEPEGDIFIVENNGGGTFAAPLQIDYVFENPISNSLIIRNISDVDEDGNMDLILQNFKASSVIWAKNEAGWDQPFELQPKCIEVVHHPNFQYVSVGDLDGLGHLGLIASSTSYTTGYVFNAYREAGSDHFRYGDAYGSEREFNSAYQDVMIADFDGDGDLDASGMSKVTAVYSEFDPAAGGFQLFEKIEDVNWATGYGDFDDDGNMNLVFERRFGDVVNWYDHTSTSPNVFQENLIGGINKTIQLWVDDIYGDGSAHIYMTSTSGKFAFFNKFGDGTVWKKVEITPSILSRWLIDVDNDGDLDIVGENTGGGPDFISYISNDIPVWSSTVQDLVPINSALGLTHAVDLDGDGDKDMIANDHDLGTVWWENYNASFGISEEQVLTTLGDYVGAFDFDDDGDLDPIIASGYRIFWIENQLGDETCMPEELSSNSFEGGFEGWTDGGADCKLLNSAPKAFDGSVSIRLRDANGVSSSVTSPITDLTDLTGVEFKFYFLGFSMEAGEDFFVQYNDGGGWSTIATYVAGTDFTNNTYFEASIALDGDIYDLNANSQFRIQCDAGDRRDHLHIDQVSLTKLCLDDLVPGNEGRGLRPVGTVVDLPEELNGKKEDLPAVQLFPNPAKTRLNIYFQGETVASNLTIYTATGQVVRQLEVAGAFIELEIADLEEGLYFISVEMADEREMVRFIKE